MKSDGFVLVADLLSLSKKTGAGIALSSHSEEDVRKVTFFISNLHILVRFIFYVTIDDSFYYQLLASYPNCA